MRECGEDGEIGLDEIFGLGSGNGTNCTELSDELRYSYIAGIGAIGLLLLVSMILLIAVCCLAIKLKRAKRKTKFFSFGSHITIERIGEPETGNQQEQPTQERTSEPVPQQLQDEIVPAPARVRDVEKEEEVGKQRGPPQLQQKPGLEPLKESVELEMRPQPRLENMTPLEPAPHRERQLASQEKRSSTAKNRNLDDDTTEESTENIAYATVRGRGALIQRKPEDRASERESSLSYALIGDGLSEEAGYKSVGRESTLSYALIGEDIYLTSDSESKESAAVGGASIPEDPTAVKYSKVTRGIKLKLLEDDCGELVHITGTPSSSFSPSLDISSLYTNVNKGSPLSAVNQASNHTDVKKNGAADEMPKYSSIKQGSPSKAAVDDSSGYTSVKKEPLSVQKGFSLDAAPNMAVERRNRDGETAFSKELATNSVRKSQSISGFEIFNPKRQSSTLKINTSKSMEGMYGLLNSEDEFKGLTTEEKIKSLDLLVSDMYKGLSDMHLGESEGGGAGGVAEGEGSGTGGVVGERGDLMEGGGAETRLGGQDDDIFYVNIDL